MPEPAFTAADVSVVIPTRNRWDILAMTLEALRDQTSSGAETIVVVNGEDQSPPDLPGIRLVRTEDAGPGAGRNLGAAASTRRIVMFLGDDTIPELDLVQRHVASHNEFPALTDAILGLVQWHPRVARNPLNRWLDWSNTQFDYQLLDGRSGEDVGPGRMFASNLSMKRELFTSVGGFDTDFYFGYEDLDLGVRLADKGLRLIYQPAAQVRHLHDYTWDAIARRFEGVAASERLMCHKHPTVEPFFLRRCQTSLARRRTLPVTRLADVIPAWLGPVRRRVRDHANAVYYRRLAPEFIRRFDAAETLCDLVDYLDGEFTPTKLNNARKATSEVDRVYAWTASAMADTHEPALSLLKSEAPEGSTVIDWAAHDGSAGIDLARAGYMVTFRDGEDIDSDYVRYRCAAHHIAADLVADADLPPAVDVVLCLDHLETSPTATEQLDRIEAAASIVVVNAAQQADGGMDAAALMERAARNGLIGTVPDRSGRTVVAYRGRRARGRQ
ncbi:MAG: glycosyltransferase [Frankiaceae bacterium]|nr:glycosyltransferase [Frankiaceae bacterium]MBV9871464.1 glycosyltransferase [Frankiaceae bacterium]